MSALDDLRDAFEHDPGVHVSVGIRVRLGRREDAGIRVRPAGGEAGVDKPADQGYAGEHDRGRRRDG